MASGRMILLVEYDEALRSTLAEQLQLHEEFTTAEAATAADGLAAVNDTHYDLILLDVELPNMDGRELCRLMRKHGVKAPVIMLPAQESYADKIIGLDAGTNDYVPKTVHVAILMASMRAQLHP